MVGHVELPSAGRQPPSAGRQLHVAPRLLASCWQLAAACPGRRRTLHQGKTLKGLGGEALEASLSDPESRITATLTAIAATITTTIPRIKTITNTIDPDL